MRDLLRRIDGARIAHLIETDGPGGAERLMAQLADRLASGGVPGIAFLPERGEGWLGRELAAAGVPVERLRLDGGPSPRPVRELAAAFRRHGIALAHSHEFTMAVYGAWAARRAGIPHVVTMHGGRYYAGRWQRRVALGVSLRMSRSVVAVSRQLAEDLRRDLRLGRGSVAVIPNGVRPAAVADSNLRAELGMGPDEVLLLAVGNLYPVKGHRVLIDALAMLQRSHPAAHVVIAGRGPERDPLLAQARALGLADRVHLLGLRADVSSLMVAADLLVHPSLSEGLPLAVLEAMFAARAIVASDVGEIRAALDDGMAGVLVPPGDPGALATEIARLLEDPERADALGAAAVRRAGAEYALDGTVARYAGVYAAALGR